MKSILKILVPLSIILFFILKMGSRVNRATTSNDEKRKIEETIKIENIRNKVNNQLMENDWVGITSVNATELLTEISFLPNSLGKRTVYFTDLGEKGCFISQEFSWTNFSGLSSDSKTNTIHLKINNNTISEKCSLDFSELVASLNNPKQNKIEINRNYLSDKIAIEGFAIKENDLDNVDNEIKQSESKQGFKVEEIVQFRKIEKELKEKFKSKPGGLSRPNFSISGQQAEIKVNVLGENHLLGNLILDNNNYIFMTNFWETSNNYSLAGLWKNIKYISPEGIDKTGDLEFCYQASRNIKFWFKESIKKE